MDFDESVKHLYSLGNEVSAMKLGLENITRLLAALGDPQKSYLKVQVAGTNGKGSACAFLGAICHKAGIRTGLYTSPHLISITERVIIDGREISECDFARHATQVRAVSEDLLADGMIASMPTFFEQVTAIALFAFAESKVDIAILETGLGGRLDATTAANAEIAAITQIEYDHQEYLGESLAEIAAEKAAIIHRGSTVILGEQTDKAMKVVVDKCSIMGVSPKLAGSVRTAGTNGRLEFETAKRGYEVKELGLRGRHQIDNAKIAILLAEVLQDKFAISQKDIVDGLEIARHAGRLEFQGRLLFDGAHNAAGAAALRAFLDEFVDRPVTMIFGAMKGKDVSNILQILVPAACDLILTQPKNERAFTAPELKEFVADGHCTQRMFLTDTVADAINVAREVVDSDAIILVTGSLYLIGEARQILMETDL